MEWIFCVHRIYKTHEEYLREVIFMKIGEVLALTLEKKVSVIAKESLDIGEKKTVEALKKAGCYSISGKKGWYFDGERSVLEKSIYDFVEKKAAAGNKKTSQENRKKGSKEVNLKTNKQVNNKTYKPGSNKLGNPGIKQVGKETKKVTYEIDPKIHDELKIRSIREKRNVSEIVNELLIKGLNMD